MARMWKQRGFQDWRSGLEVEERRTMEASWHQIWEPLANKTLLDRSRNAAVEIVYRSV
jgi:hypothetical protein